MKTFMLILALPLLLHGQLTMALTGPATARPGTAVHLSLSASTPGADTAAAGFQWTLNLPPGGYTETAVIGATGSAAGKQITCSVDGALCLAVGMNTTVVGNGVLATVTLNVPAAASGSVNMPLTGLLAVSPTGTAIVPVSGPQYSLLVLLKQDINGDGKVDVTDVQLEIQAVLTMQTGSSCDMNGDGKCDVTDVQNVILKALGLI